MASDSGPPTRARFDHIHLACRDLARSTDFYTRHLGATVLARYRWRDIDSVALRIGATRLNLRTRVDADTGPIDHIGVAIADLAAVYPRLARAGVDVRREPRPWEPDEIVSASPGIILAGEFAFLRGPDEELIELVDRGRRADD